MREYSVDNIIKLLHSPVIQSSVTAENAIGVTDSTTMRTLGFTPSDTNSIFVSKTGNDTTAVGTESDPVLTIEHANDLLTATKTHIVILDSGTYEEPYFDFDSNLVGIYATLGETPKVKPSQTITADNYTVDSVGTDQFFSTFTTFSSCHALDNGEFLNIGCKAYDGSILYMQKCDKDGNKVGGAVSPPGSDVNDYDCYSIAGGFIVVYLNHAPVGGATALRIYCYNNDMSTRWSQIYSYSAAFIHAIGGFGDDNVIIYYMTASESRFIVIKISDGEIVIGQSSLGFQANAGLGTCVAYNGGSIFIGQVFLGSNCQICKINSGGVLIDSQVLYNSGVSGGDRISNDCLINKDGELVIVYDNYYDTANGIYVMSLDPSDFSEIMSETLVENVAYQDQLVNDTNINQSWDGTYIISFNRTYSGYLYVYTNDFSEILYSDEASTDGIGNGGAYNPVIDRYLTFNYYNSSYSDVRGFVLKGFVWDWWTTFAGDIEFNGIDFDCEGVDGLNKLIDTNSSTETKAKWCTFQNISRVDYKDIVEYPLILFKSTAGNNTVNNILVKDCDTGMYFESNNVDLSYCHFYRLLASAAYALQINGAAVSSGDIAVEHIDVFNCTKGIYFQNNNGSNEVLKNSIIHQCAGYGIIADTEITYNNCVNTCDVSGAAEGTKVVNLNPMYINEGAIDPDDIDLNIKIRALGYPITSPAYQLADDGENAGALLVDYSYEETSRTTTELPKPLVAIVYEAVNPVTHTGPDGSDTFYYDALREIFTLTWSSLLKDDFDKILAMCNFRGTDKSVYLYLEPTTNPSTYLETTLSWVELPGSPEYPVQSDLGVNRSISITLSRPYPEAS